MDDTTAMQSVINPSYYRQHELEFIEVVEGLELSFHEGCVLKYLIRSHYSYDAAQDLRKALWYLCRMLQVRIPHEELAEEERIFFDWLVRVRPRTPSAQAHDCYQDDSLSVES